MFRSSNNTNLRTLLLMVLAISASAHAANPHKTIRSYDSGAYCTSAIAIADVNDDGRLDLVAVSVGGSPDCALKGGTVSVWLGNGDGTFQTAQTYGSNFAFSPTIAIGDLNGDGKLDLIVASNSIVGAIGVMLGNGDGSFQDISTTYASGGNDAQSVAVADLNQDGKLDVVVGNFCPLNDCHGDGVVGVLLGIGDGTFQPVQTYDAGNFEGGPYGQTPISVAVADVNRDGKIDLLVGNAGCTSSTTCQEGSVAVLLGTGDGTFQAAQLFDSGGTGLSSMAVGDVNGDQVLDVAFTNACLSNVTICNTGNAGVLLGNGDGSFQPAVTYLENSPHAIALGDVNRDGKLDLLIANQTIPNTLIGGASVLLGVGDGTFQVGQSFKSAGDFADAIAVGDLNADGKPDVVITNAWKHYYAFTTGSIAVILSK